MKKKDFITLILSVIGGVFFGIGMCMCLLPEWNAFNQGVVVAVIGAVVLLAMVIVRRRMEGKPAIVLNKKIIFSVLVGIAGVLMLGAGMCLVMLWEQLIVGIVLGLLGIVVLLCLIPICKGLED